MLNSRAVHSYLDAMISVFAGISPAVTEAISLRLMLERIRSGTYAREIAEVRALAQAGDEERKKARKERLVAFTPCCQLRTRAQKVAWPEKLIGCTGVVYYDLDHVPNLGAVRARLLTNPHLVFAFVSPSGDGLKIGIATNAITSPDDYKHPWAVVLEALKQAYPDVHISEDRHIKYLGALCFVSHDADAYMNEEAAPFVIPPAAPQSPPKPKQEYRPRMQQGTSPVDAVSTYARVSAALGCIPNHDADYDVWLSLGMALHSTGDPWARDLWDSWSQQSGKFDARKQETSWKSFHGDGAVTLGSLFHLAAQHGYMPPSSASPLQGMAPAPTGTAPQAPQEPVVAPVLEHTAPWPTLDDAAYYGLAGEIVKIIRPHTESDPVAILVQLLVMVGSVIGRTPFFPVEADQHHMNIFVCLVGISSRSRKGSSAGHPKRLLSEIDPQWKARVKGGLSSGEGVIWYVRDAVWGHNKKGEDVCLDSGAEDKRFCILESEFARGLAKTAQDGNVLSSVLRQAWDHGDLHTLVSGRQKSPVEATNAHVSVITHITGDELRRLLSDTEAANGFGNRFLWVCAKRSQLLPRGGKYPANELRDLKTRLGAAIFEARSIGEMQRTKAAETRWETIYTGLADGQPGLLGAITARAEAQVLRLSCLYALLDKTNAVDVRHLEAAYALWRYCEGSARYIFGDVLGDPLADDLLRMLRQAGSAGMTRTDLYNAFDHHQKSAAIGQALMRLQRDGLARPTQEPTAGRSVERWHACTSMAPAQKAQEAQEDGEALDLSDDIPPKGACTQSSKSSKSPSAAERDRTLFEHNEHFVSTEGDSAITPVNTDDEPISDPPFEHNVLFVQGVHTHTATERDGQVVCLHCGEVLAGAASPVPAREVFDV